MSPHVAPSIGVQLAFAGPYESGKRFLFSEPAGIHVEPVSAPAENAPASAAPSSGPAQAGSAQAGAALVAQSGCMGCHGASFQGGIGPALFGIEHRLTPQQIADAIAHPHPPMPNFGFSPAQIAGVIAYLSSLDGGASGSGATISLNPANPTNEATLSVRFPGPVPSG